MSYAKIISFEVKSELHTKTERTFYENLYSFCNSFNLEDDCFVHNSVVSFLPHQNAKYPPQNYPTKQGAKKQWIRHVTNLIKNCSLKKVKKGDDNSYKGKNFADEFCKLYTSYNHANFTSCYNKNCKLRSQIFSAWKVIIPLTELLTLTEKLALLGERIKFLTSSGSNKYQITFASFFFEGTVCLILECPRFFKKIVTLEMF